jgi:4-amino-4-deoxy-L-arabinose transferase-like glycosyltransferase
VLRLAAVLWLSDTVPHSDAAYYHLAAQKMAADWKFPFDRAQVEYYGKLGWWPPLYPASISLVYRAVGVSHRAVVFVQVLLGTLVVALVYGIGARIGGRRLAWVAALLVAIDPTYILWTNILGSENLYVLWLALGLWFLCAPWPPAGEPGHGGAWQRYRSLVVAGCMFGLGTLTRAIGALVALVVALASRSRAATRHAWLVGGAVLVGASALVVAPWTLRNQLVAGSPALVCFGGGLNFYFGHNDGPPGYVPLERTPMAQLTTQAAIDHIGYKLGLETLGRNPFGFLTRGAQKAAALFGSPGYAAHENSAILLPDGWQTDPEKERQADAMRARQRAKNVWLDGLLTQIAQLHSWILLAGALVACTRWRRLPEGLRICAWLCAYWIVAHVVFWAQPRFRYPMEIPMALLAARAFTDVADRRRPRSLLAT